VLEPDALRDLPGSEIVLRGLADLTSQATTTESLLVAIAAPRLSWLGVEIPKPLPEAPEAALYARLEEQHGRDAHGRYNAWLRRLIRFERALEQHVFGERRRRAAEQRSPR
jgi:hypothetical protein